LRVALTGVSGFIGSVVARRLSEAGHRVTGLVRETSRRDHVEPYVDRFVTGDHADESCWGGLLDGADCLVHNSVDWGPIKSGDMARHWESNLLGSLRLIDAASPGQVIFVSTIAVHHDMRPRWAGVIDEDHPTRPGTMYGAYKAAVEAHLWADHHATGRNTSAVRPCGVYGIDPRLTRSYGFGIIRDLRAGEPYNKPGGGKFVHVEDVAAAIVAMAGNDAVAGRPLNMVDCYARWSDWAVMAAGLLGVEVEIDQSSPAKPINMFTKDAVESLGVRLDRGHAGIRAHLAELIGAMDEDR
jgi:nucleoside-diphosphate-sugar epimerase